MLPIILCDDNLSYVEYVKDIIDKCICIENLDMEIVLATDQAKAVLDYASAAKPPFIYFLDIDLKDSNYTGITLAHELRTSDPRGFIIFITSHEELSYLTFHYHVEAMDYIIKDEPDKISERIRQCLFHAEDLFLSQNNTAHQTLSIRLGDKIHIIRQEDIYCLQTASSPHKIRILTKNALYEQSESLHELSLQLDKRFFQCHKSCIINLSYVQELDRAHKKVLLTNGVTCPVSSRLVRELYRHIPYTC